MLPTLRLLSFSCLFLQWSCYSPHLSCPLPESKPISWIMLSERYLLSPHPPTPWGVLPFSLSMTLKSSFSSSPNLHSRVSYFNIAFIYAPTLLPFLHFIILVWQNDPNEIQPLSTWSLHPCSCTWPEKHSQPCWRSSIELKNINLKCGLQLQVS